MTLNEEVYDNYSISILYSFEKSNMKYNNQRRTKKVKRKNEYIHERQHFFKEKLNFKSSSN